jgi:PAS domain S-box-containing protein
VKWAVTKRANGRWCGDGSHLPVNMLATPVLDEQGLWVGHLAICIDITERKRVHEALAARDC